MGISTKSYAGTPRSVHGHDATQRLPNLLSELVSVLSDALSVLDTLDVASLTAGTPASVIGANTENFAIVASTSDKLSISVDGSAPVGVTLTAGAARTAAQVAADINAQVPGVIAADDGTGKVEITSASTGSSSSIEFLPVTNAAYTVLGFTVSAVYAGVNGNNKIANNVADVDIAAFKAAVLAGKTAAITASTEFTTALNKVKGNA